MRKVQARHNGSSGMAIPAALIMILLLTSIVAILSRLSIHNLEEIELNQATDDTYYAAEGAVNKQISEMSVLSTLWAQKPNLATPPDNYMQYYPTNYSSSNGIPTCSGIACHRDMYPIGGGLIKNLGPVNGDGDQVDSSYPITEQLDPDNLPDPDISLSNVDAWSQVERLDESTPDSSTVGGSLSNSIAEAGNARTVRYRVTGISTKSLKGRHGYATVIAVIEMPLS